MKGSKVDTQIVDDEASQLTVRYGQYFTGADDEADVLTESALTLEGDRYSIRLKSEGPVDITLDQDDLDELIQWLAKYQLLHSVHR